MEKLACSYSGSYYARVKAPGIIYFPDYDSDVKVASKGISCGKYMSLSISTSTAEQNTQTIYVHTPF